MRSASEAGKQDMGGVGKCTRLPVSSRSRTGNGVPLPMPPKSLVLVQTIANRQVVVAMCSQARVKGVRVGFSLAQARALCPELVHADEDPGRDMKGLEALARWMMRFTPRVQCGLGGPLINYLGRQGLFLDLTGTGRFFGSLEKLLDQIASSLAAMGVTARVAIAPMMGAAWALTYAPPPNRPIVTDNLAAALSPLPPVALRLDDRTLATLHHLGLENIGQILKLPRHTLPARFGPELLQRIDQALGNLPEPLTPLPYHAPIEAAVDFDGIVDSLEALWLAFKDLIAQVTLHLVRRGLGVRQLMVTFLRPYAPAIEKRIDLSRPSRKGTILFNLIRCAMETIGDVGKARGKRAPRFKLHSRLTLDETDFVPRGFTGLRLVVSSFEQLTDEQILLLEEEEAAGKEELDRLVERLRIKLGEEACLAVKAVESHVPERAHQPWHGLPARDSSGKTWPGSSCYVFRPLHLLPMPREIPVMVRPSHDRDGAPVSFGFEGQSHRIVHAVGPERISGMWWTGNDKTRDYFDVEDEAGKRWWVFRVAQTFKWYLHGKFE
jgi:protein ImuB